MESSQPGLAAVVFDLDGTLIDSTDGIRSALAAGFTSAGLSFPDVDLRKVIGPPIRTIAARIEPELTESQLAIIERVYRAEYDSEGWRKTTLFQAAIDVLATLARAGLHLFIVTNKPALPTRQILDHLGIAQFFSTALSRDSRQPAFATKAEMLLTLLREQHLSPTTTVMLGDTPEDAHAAQANGLDFVFASYGYGEMPDAARRITKLAELPFTLGLNL